MTKRKKIVWNLSGIYTCNSVSKSFKWAIIVTNVTGVSCCVQLNILYLTVTNFQLLEDVFPYLTGRLTISANDNSQIILRWLITLPRLISCFESWFCICFVHPVLSDLSNFVCNDEIVKCIFYPLCGCIFCDFLEFPSVKSLKIFTVKMLK